MVLAFGFVSRRDGSCLRLGSKCLRRSLHSTRVRGRLKRSDGERRCRSSRFNSESAGEEQGGKAERSDGRRNILSKVGCATIASRALGATPHALAEQEKYERSKLGVPYEDIYSGSSAEKRVVKDGDQVVIDYVLRRSNGYFIYGTIQGVSFQPSDVPAEPFQFTVGDEGVIVGLSDVIIGMSKGGKRRALVPPRLGYTPDVEEFAKQPKSLSLEPQPPTFATKRQLLNHCNEPLLFEIELVKIR